jgi:hypothetical protein
VKQLVGFPAAPQRLIRLSAETPDVSAGAAGSRQIIRNGRDPEGARRNRTVKEPSWVGRIGFWSVQATRSSVAGAVVLRMEAVEADMALANEDRHDRPDDAELKLIESRFQTFLRSRAVGPDEEVAVRTGRFAAFPGAAEPDLFGSLDIAYAAFILGALDGMTGEAGRSRWIDHILSFQSEDGWFRAHDGQQHGVEHSTAYALGALQLLSHNDGAAIAGRLKPFRQLMPQLATMPDEQSPPFSLSMLDRVHFWRGSHRAAGIAAIIGAVRDLGLSTEALLGLADADGWLRGWWRYFAARADVHTGYWQLGPAPLKIVFNVLYRRRHDPALAAMGGAVHLYWIAERLGLRFPQPEATIRATARLLRPTGLYEEEPYCIDLDGNFLIARALRQRPLDGESDSASIGLRALASSRDAVASWFSARHPEDWHLSSHKLPGAFAAIAEADLALRGEARWKDVFEVCWWL